MTTQSGGNMLMQALKKLVGIVIKVVVLIIALTCELTGKLLLKIGEVIKTKTK